jgi:protein phosphatase
MPTSPSSSQRRYVWAQGKPATPPLPGTLLAGRYQVIRYPLLVDTAIEAPLPLESVPPAAEPYLALSLFSVNIPRPFTQITLPETGETLLLLEEPPVLATSQPGVEVPPLFPTMTEAWSKASPIHQLTWLWQLSQLWQPCTEQGVTASLLDPSNIRVDGEDVRLLLLIGGGSASLIDLGTQWRSLVPTAAPSIQDYLMTLCDRLIAGEGSSEGLAQSLSAALIHLGNEATVSVEWATFSDQGPTRQRNEDACFPPSGTSNHATVSVLTLMTHPAPLVIVCDGIGGHQGGDVASHTAIAQTTQRLQTLLQTPQLPHTEVCAALEDALLVANEVITQQNDAAQRQDRDRMGTTVVLALVYGLRLYIAHLGDSRAYRVRSHSCRQLTLDDDVAAREMRLGLGLYQDALQNPGSGALVQALGMASSQHLHPTVQLYPIAEPAMLLLCSDGLSDNGLVEHLWQTEINPLLTSQSDLTTAGKRLVYLANTHNGHDNVTVGLLRVLPQPCPSTTPVPPTLTAVLTQPAPPTTQRSRPQPTRTPTLISSTSPAANPPAIRLWPLLATIGLVAALIGGTSALLRYGWQQRQAIPPPDPSTTSGDILAPNATPPGRTSTTVMGSDVAIGDYLQITAGNSLERPMSMIVTPDPPTAETAPAIALPRREIPIGSIVQVKNRQQTPDNQLWIRFTICSVPASDSLPVPDSSISPPEGGSPATVETGGSAIAQPGDEGWLLASDLATFTQRSLDRSPSQQGLCMD